MPLPGPPRPGQRLYLEGHGHDVLTSNVIAVERPPKETVEQYPLEGPEEPGVVES